MLVHLDALTGFYSTLLQRFSRFTPAFFKCLKYGRYIKRRQKIIMEEASRKNAINTRNLIRILQNIYYNTLSIKYNAKLARAILREKRKN